MSNIMKKYKEEKSADSNKISTGITSNPTQATKRLREAYDKKLEEKKANLNPK